MVHLRPGLRDLILVDMLLLHIFPITVQGVDPMSLKLRRLTEQFQQFQALTRARLHMLTLNQSRKNTSEGLESRVQVLDERWHQTSEDLKDLQQSTKQEIGGLREWSKKLEKKSKRMEGRLALMERNLRESRRYAQKKKADPDPDVSNLTLELQNQEERLAALQDQRDELLVGLRGLQESLKDQVLRVSRLEGRLREALQVNGEEHQSYHRGSQTYRGGRPERILERLTQSRPEGVSNPQTRDHSRATAGSRNSSQSSQYQETPNQPKHPKTQKPRPQLESYPHKQISYPPHEAESTDYLPYPELYDPQSQKQVRASTRSYPSHQDQLTSQQSVPYVYSQIHPTQSQPRIYHQRHRSLLHVESGPKRQDEKLGRTRVGAQHVASSDILPQPLSESSQPKLSGWYGGEEQENYTKLESSVIHGLLQIPVRQKIPAYPVPKKDATVCNVDSMLFFPTASAENYVTFSLTLPDLHELSVCLWLRVEAQHVGTLLSYATDDNDNQIVLYGRSSSASSGSVSSSSSSFHPSDSSYPFSQSSSSSLDFVIGDTVHRRLPVKSFLDARWHHLCVLWSSIQGRFWHYTDRHLSSSGSNFRKGWEVPGGGSVVVGQEQDDVGGGFDPAEGFAGQVAGFRMWNRVLSPAEVDGVAEGRGVPRGVVLGMEDIKELHGEVQQVSCECLEHCV